MRNLFITTAFVNREPLRRLCKVLDATNADLKAFDDGFYQSLQWDAPLASRLRAPELAR